MQFIINGLITGILYSLLAIGFALVYNATKVFHIAAAALYVFAAYIFHLFAVTLSFPVLVAGCLSLVLTSGLSLGMDVSVYRPLERRGASGDVAMIASIGMMIIIVNLLIVFFGNEAESLKKTAADVVLFQRFQMSSPQILQASVGGLTILLFLLFLEKARWGIHLRALSADRTLYEMLGHDMTSARNIIFLASGAFIALSSCLSVYDFGVDVHKGLDVLVYAIVAMILGGTGRFGACVAGGLTLGLLQSLSVYFFSSHWEGAITFLLLLLVLFLRPQGIAGYKERRV